MTKTIDVEEIIEEFELLRGGFSQARMAAAQDKNVFLCHAMDVYHKIADKFVMDYGGKTVREPKHPLQISDMKTFDEMEEALDNETKA